MNSSTRPTHSASGMGGNATFFPMQGTQMQGSMPVYPLPVISPAGFPTGVPAGQPYNGPFPSAPSMGGGAALPAMNEIPSSLSSTAYTAGYLRTLIGKRVRIDFLIGTNTFMDRSGILVEVGASYIVLQSLEANTRIMCDLYSIKFVTIFAQ